MELHKFERQLRLMMLLTQNRKYTLEELGKRLDMSSRNVYRYIDGREIVYRPLLNSDNDFVYYRAYWAKMINIDKVAYKEVNFKSKLIEWSQKILLNELCSNP